MALSHCLHLQSTPQGGAFRVPGPGYFEDRALSVLGSPSCPLWPQQLEPLGGVPMCQWVCRRGYGLRRLMRGKAQSKAQCEVTATYVCGSCSWARFLWPASVNRITAGCVCVCDHRHVTAGGVGPWAIGPVIWGAVWSLGVCLHGRCAGERWGSCAWGGCTSLGSR